MNRRNFFRALSALAALPFVPKFLKAKPVDKPPEFIDRPWDVELFDSQYVYQWADSRLTSFEEMSTRAYRLDGPEMMDWGGDVGLKPTYISSMYCGDICEKYYSVDGWGFVQSTREKHVNGIWVTEWIVLRSNTRDKKWETIEA